MCYREDYYKFTHFLMPHMVFNYGRLFVYRLMRNEEQFIENLKKVWSTIELEQTQLRSVSPEFKIDIVQLNVEQTGIVISIPEAKEDMEAAYIGITYDKDDNFRYFTYEIGRGGQEEKVHFLCEHTANGEHYHYGVHLESDKSLFIKEISGLLVCDLL